tara:strand:- start:49 stop:249 length:201 start_codon:yes stop_codon:yes gene_type:complete
MQVQLELFVEELLDLEVVQQEDQARQVELKQELQELLTLEVVEVVVLTDLVIVQEVELVVRVVQEL